MGNLRTLTIIPMLNGTLSTFHVRIKHKHQIHVERGRSGWHTGVEVSGNHHQGGLSCTASSKEGMDEGVGHEDDRVLLAEVWDSVGHCAG